MASAARLLSLALVPEDGSDEFYVILACAEPIEPWVERNVLPFLDMVPDGLASPRMHREQAALALSACARRTMPGPKSSPTGPTTSTYFCGLLSIAPGRMVPVPDAAFRLLPLVDFSPAENSAVPHNALHDARALRDHVVNQL